MIRAVHRLLLRTSATRAGVLWVIVYRAVAFLWGAYLARGERNASIYAYGSLARGEVMPGLSDVDVAIVLAADPAGPGLAAERTSARWARLRRAVRATDLLFDYPMVLEEDELAQVAESSTLTFGIGWSDPGAATYFGPRVSHDRNRLLERPGVYSSTAHWRLLAGPERRPPRRDRDRDLRRIAAWLELIAWWQWAFPVCIDQSGPRTASLCVKLIAEPARVWLWLAHGERAEHREDVFTLALRRLPEEAEALQRAAALNRALASSPEPPVAETLPALVRLSSRIVALIEAEIADAGTTEVRLAGGCGGELIFPRGSWRRTPVLTGGGSPPVHPLCDWRSLTCPLPLDESFALVAGDPADSSCVGAALASQRTGPYPVLQSDQLMVLPSPRWRSRLRAIKSSFSDPVMFALASASAHAWFPNVPGFGAKDVAARALAEHRAWLGGPAPASHDARASADALGMLFNAARVALFADSLAWGVPELPLTLAETARQLAQRTTTATATAQDGLERYRDFMTSRTPPPEATLSAMRRLVEQLPGYEACAPATQMRSASSRPFQR